MLRYLKLYRLDAGLLAFLSYVVGSVIAHDLAVGDVFIALGVSLVSMNFVYSFNSWSDWKIDRINKPARPIASGRISPRSALIYSLALLALALIYPLFVYRSWFTLLLFLLLPVLGLLYSVEPIRLKKNLATGVLTTSLILIIPIVLGFSMSSSDTGNAMFFVGLFAFCLSVVPLKDIEDVAGDACGGCDNWLQKLGRRRLLLFSAIGLGADGILAYVVAMDPLLRACLLAFIGSALALVGLFSLVPRRIGRLYRTIILVVIAEGAAAFLLLRLDIGPL